MTTRTKACLLFLSLVITLYSAMGQGTAKTTTGSDPKTSSNDFFLEAEELELFKACNEIGLYFGKTVMVFPDIKNTKITCNIKNVGFEKAVELVSWVSGVDAYEKDGIWYFGGNADYIEVMDNVGLDNAVEGVFKNAVRIVEDKIIISGTEKEVKRLGKAVKDLQKKDSVTVRVWGYEITTDKMLELGIDIDKALEYSFSWEGLVQWNFNPIQNWVMSINASIKAEQSSDDLKLVLDTIVTSMSGKDHKFTVGEAVDREIYTVTEYGTTLVSGYNTLQTGYILKLTAFKNVEDWLYNISVENSVEHTEKRRNRLVFENTVVLKGREPALIGRIIKNSESIEVQKGIPFLCDIPYLGYLFRVTKERRIIRNVLFFMQRLDENESEKATKIDDVEINLQFINAGNKMQDWFGKFIP